MSLHFLSLTLNFLAWFVVWLIIWMSVDSNWGVKNKQGHKVLCRNQVDSSFYCTVCSWVPGFSPIPVSLHPLLPFSPNLINPWNSSFQCLTVNHSIKHTVCKTLVINILIQAGKKNPSLGLLRPLICLCLKSYHLFLWLRRRLNSLNPYTRNLLSPSTWPGNRTPNHPLSK